MLNTFGWWTIFQWFILIPITCFTIYKYVLRTWSHFADRKIQFIRGIPLFGARYRSIIGLDNEANVLNYLYQAHPAEPFIGFFEQFGKPTYLIRDPELIQKIRGSLKTKTSAEEENGDTFLGENNLNTVYNMINSISKEFCNSLELKLKSGVSDYEAKDLFGRYASNVISILILGTKINTLKDSNSPYFRVCSIINEFKCAQNVSLYDYVGLKPILKYCSVTRNGKKIEKHFKTVILKKIGKRFVNGSPKSKIIDFLLDAVQNEEQKSIDSGCCGTQTCLGHLDKDSLSNYMDFLWDGFNVVQNAVPFLVYELAMNPDIQTNLFKEISDTQKTHGENINYDNLSKLKYLDMVLSESLRRWSPVQFRREILSKSDTLDGLRHVTVRLEAGDSVWIPTHALHMDEKYFPNSERFDPERFNDQNKSKIKENVFQPYGIHGNRQSTAFATMQLKAILYHLLQTFIIDQCEETQDPLKLQRGVNYLTCEDGCWFGLRRRSV